MKNRITREELQSQVLEIEMKIATCVNEKEREALEITLYQSQCILLKMNKKFLNEIENEQIN